LEGPSISWIIEAFLTVQDGGPVIGELRIGTPGEVPPGGLTKVFLNSIPIREIHSHLRELETDIHKQFQGGGRVFVRKSSPPSDFLPLFPKLEKRIQTPKGKRGRPGRPIVFYAEVARDYDAAFRAGENPIVAVTKTRPKMTREQARDAVSRARREGLLTNAPRPGFPGGRLTPKAEALLKQNQKGKSHGRQRSTKRR
jgi:hypothetical protein